MTTTLGILQVAWFLLISFAFSIGLVLSRSGESRRGTRLTLAGAGILCLWVACFLIYEIGPGAGLETWSHWSSAWLFSDGTKGQLNFGVGSSPLRVTLNWVLVGLTSIFAAIQLREGSTKDEHSILAGLLIAASASLFSLGVAAEWLSLAGVLIGSLGAAICMGGRWEEVVDADGVARLFFGRFLGWILFLCGALLLSAEGQEMTASTDVLAIWLILLGVWSQTQAFPWVAALSAGSGHQKPFKPFISEVLPAFVLIAVILHLQKPMASIGTATGIFWVFLISSLLTTLTGLFQKNAQKYGSHAFAALISLSFAASSLGHPKAAFWMGLGAIFSRCLLLISGGLEKNTDSKWVRWSSIGAAFLAFSSPLSLGFAGTQTFLTSISESTALAGIFVFALFMGQTLVWKAAFVNHRWSERQDQMIYFGAYGLIAIATFSLGWTGAWFAGGFLGNDEQMFPSWSAQALAGFLTESTVDLASQQVSGLLLVGLSALSIIFAYFTSLRKGDHWIAIEKKAPRTFHFVSNGFLIEATTSRATRALSRRLHQFENGMREVFPGRWPRRILSGVVGFTLRWIHRAELVWDLALTRSSARAVNMPGQVLQLIQNGSVQWYLMIALAVILSLLAHAMRNG